MNRKILAAATAIAALSLVTGCGLQSGGGAANDGGAASTLTIYSPRPSAITDHVVAEFEKANPQYDVQLLTLGAAEVADRVRAESGNPQADVWWGGTPSLFERATADNLVEPFSDDVVNLVGDEFRGTDSKWIAEMRQLQLIIYNHDMMSEEEAPKDWDDLIDPKYKDKILIRDVAPSGTMRGIYSAMIYREYEKTGSPDAGYEFLRKLDANTLDYAANPEDLYLRLQRQEAPISLWNHQDTLTQAKGGAPFSIIVPASGAVINTDGIARVAGSTNPEGADAFAKFIFSDGTQTWLAENVFQIPTIEISSEPQWLADLEIKELETDRAVVAENETTWTTYWLENIKNQG